MRRYVITWAQSDTPVHAGFRAALKHFPGKLHIVRGFYHNPTSLYEKYKEEGASWAPELERYMVDEPMVLVPNRLVLRAEIRTQPTASNPLSGLEVYAGEASAIIGHPKRAVITVPTATRQPRLLVSTGAITMPNYSKSKAGAKGTAHHIIGASVVEIDDAGHFFIFQITWDEKSKSFTHLDVRYSANSYGTAPPAAGMVIGDRHSGKEDPHAVMATHEQYAVLKPRVVHHHDFFDNDTRNHHESKSKRRTYEKRFKSVRDEVVYSFTHLREEVAAAPEAEHRFVRSNHDEALDRWLEEHDVNKDAHNTPYWHALCASLYAHYDRTGEFPDAWPHEMHRLLVKAGWGAREFSKVRFLKLNESSKVAGIECGFHGHLGINGARGNVQSYRRLGVKTITGHGHVFWWQDGAMAVGHTSVDDHRYNNLPGGWLQGNAVIYADGKRSFLPIVKGTWRMVSKRRAR